MNYIFHDEDLSLTEKICRINGIREDDLDIGIFDHHDEPDVLRAFKEKLLSYADKRFFIVGDYDCDGICSTTIMKKLFDDIGIASNYYIPSRRKEGYGLNRRIVDTAAQHGFEVLLCVDNGIIANEELNYARSLGLITMVIDHHEYDEEPSSDHYLHPDLFTEEYSDMCASGLCALLSTDIREDKLTLVYGGLATLADMVRVIGYNRYLLKRMMTILHEETIYPIDYLLKKRDFDYETLSFDVIPKINAVSRMEESLNVNYVVRYLLSDASGCMAFLPKIEEINASRKQLTKEMAAMAGRLCDDEEKMIVVSSEAFKEGLCGLVANRLMYEKEKPVIIFSEAEGMLKGSGRAPKGFDLHGYLYEVRDLFAAFGGHAQAVGLTLEKDRFDDLLDYIHTHDFVSLPIEKDVLCIKQEDISVDVIETLDSLKPFGQGFEEPIFCLEDPDYTKKFMIKGLYPKFVLRPDLEAISFNADDSRKCFSRMIGHIRKDQYHSGRLSFVIEDLI